MVINFDFRNGAKKSGRLDHPLLVMVKYISIYFDIFQQKLDDIGGHQGTSKTKKIVNEMHWTTPGLHCEWL